MIEDLDRRLVELRFLDGIEKVEHVPYQTGDQFWVRFSKPLDLGRLQQVARKHDYYVVPFASLQSKLPRRLGEVVWDGVTHIVMKKVTRRSKFASSLGFEPEGIAKVVIDLHEPYQVFIATTEDGIQVLYEYLGLSYTPPLQKPAPATVPRPIGQQAQSGPVTPQTTQTTDATAKAS